MFAARIVLPLLVLAACESHVDEDMKRRTQSMVEQTVPPGGVLFEAPSWSRNSLGWAGRWRIESNTPCSEYRAWIKEQLGESYRLTTDSQHRMVGSKYLEADAYLLSFELFSGKTVCQASIQFEAMAH
jgi:hypothetical protein